MTKTIPVFYLFLLFLCNFIAVSLAVEASGGDDSGGGSPEESGGGGGGGAGGEQGRDEQLVVAAGEIRDHMQLKRQEFCLICIIAANRQLDISQLPEDSGNQAALIQYKMVSNSFLFFSLLYLVSSHDRVFLELYELGSDWIWR